MILINAYMTKTDSLMFILLIVSTVFAMLGNIMIGDLTILLLNTPIFLVAWYFYIKWKNGVMSRMF